MSPKAARRYSRIPYHGGAEEQPFNIVPAIKSMVRSASSLGVKEARRT